MICTQVCICLHFTRPLTPWDDYHGLASFWEILWIKGAVLPKVANLLRFLLSRSVNLGTFITLVPALHMSAIGSFSVLSHLVTQQAPQQGPSGA